MIYAAPPNPGLAFKENSGGKAPIVINKPELATGRWMRVGRGNQMRIKLKTGNALTFDDFTNQNKLEVRLPVPRAL